jgi:hypothetical protein
MNTQKNEWPRVSAIFKRFIFCYLVLYIFPYGFEYIYALDKNDLSFWTHIVPWFGETFLGLSFNPENLAKGLDSKYDVARFLLCAILANIATVIWLFIDSKYQVKYGDKLNALLRTIIRYQVGLAMILYGMCKVLPLQFGILGIDGLESSIGEYSPMGFLGVFMSYSRFYTTSTGLIEVIGGLFLLFRPTTFIGAVICFIATFNVVLIDIGYDVVVKFFALHLLLMIILLLVDDMKRLMQFFILNKQTQPSQYPVLFTSTRVRQIGYLVKSAILIYFFVTTISFVNKKMGQIVPKYPTLTRLYQVEDFVINGDTIPPLLTDTIRWKSISIAGTFYLQDMLKISTMASAKMNYRFQADTIRKTLVFHPANDSADKYFMKYDQSDDHYFIFKGKHNSDSLWIKTTVVARNEYRLTRRRIRWVRDL